MATIDTLRTQARNIANSAEDTEVRELAKIMEQLCGECEEIDRKAKTAMSEAMRAKHAPRH
jgi:outer membrane murein-binding lipoprotein Lpp